MSVDRRSLKLRGLDWALSFEQVKAWLRINFTRIYAICPGTEFAGVLRLHDCSNKSFWRRHLLVGLSRSRADAAVNLRE
jgi:hypothetical protein